MIDQWIAYVGHPGQSREALVSTSAERAAELLAAKFMPPVLIRVGRLTDVQMFSYQKGIKIPTYEPAQDAG